MVAYETDKGFDRASVVAKWRDLAVLGDRSQLCLQVLDDLFPSVWRRLHIPFHLRWELKDDIRQSVALGLWNLLAVEGFNWSAPNPWLVLFVSCFQFAKLSRRSRSCLGRFLSAKVQEFDDPWGSLGAWGFRVPACLEDDVFDGYTADLNLVQFRRARVRAFLALKVREGLTREAAIRAALTAFDVEFGQASVVRASVSIFKKTAMDVKPRGFRRLRSGEVIWRKRAQNFCIRMKDWEEFFLLRPLPFVMKEARRLGLKGEAAMAFFRSRPGYDVGGMSKYSSEYLASHKIGVSYSVAGSAASPAKGPGSAGAASACF
jgi:hypothetical protein